MFAILVAAEAFSEPGAVVPQANLLRTSSLKWFSENTNAGMLQSLLTTVA